MSKLLNEEQKICPECGHKLSLKTITRLRMRESRLKYLQRQKDEKEELERKAKEAQEIKEKHDNQINKEKDKMLIYL